MSQINGQSFRTECRCHFFQQFLLQKKTLCALLNPRRFLPRTPAQIIQEDGWYRLLLNLEMENGVLTLHTTLAPEALDEKIRL